MLDAEPFTTESLPDSHGASPLPPPPSHPPLPPPSHPPLPPPPPPPVTPPPTVEAAAKALNSSIVQRISSGTDALRDVLTELVELVHDNMQLILPVRRV